MARGLRASRCYVVAVEDRHPTGAKFKAPVQLENGLWLDTNCTGPDVVRLCRFLLEYVGEDPAHYQIVF